MTLTSAPTLETERLILRGPQVGDVDALADQWIALMRGAGLP